MGVSSRPRLVLLLALLAAAQLVCLAAAALWIANVADDTIRDRAAVGTEQLAVAHAETLARTLGSDAAILDLAQLRRQLERGRLPAGSSVHVVDPEGRVRGERIWSVRPDGVTTPLVYEQDEAPVLATWREPGLAAVPGAHGDDVIAIRSVPLRQLQVQVRVPATPWQADVDGITRRVAGRGLIVVALVAVPLLVVTLLLVRDYEKRFSHVHDDLEELVAKRSGELLQSREGVILGLAKLAESRDDHTGQHLERIRGYVRVLGEAMVGRHPEVTAEFVETLVDTAALHDIGKVGIPDEVLLNPGALSDEQREIVKKHTLIGGDTLLAVKRRWGDDQFLVTACEIAFAHHERYDGEGYPFGLSGDIIPISARIVAIADVYDALTTHRVYRDALDHEEACRIIAEGAGTRFDPMVVEVFMTVQERFLEVRQELDARR